MSESQIRLYYKNVTEEILGSEQGISKSQFDVLAEKVEPIISRIEKERSEGKHKYRDLPYDKKMVADVKAVAADMMPCENFVVLGIGGSALGNIALQTALNPYMYNMDCDQRKTPRLFVVDNVDPAQMSSFFKWLGSRIEKTVFNVISKSGRTAETASQFLTICEMIKSKLGADAFKKHIIATTDANVGTMRKIVDDFGLTSLEVPDGVGGRFSVLSAVGLLSAAVCGIDIDELLAGAADMDKKVSQEIFYQNPAALNAAINWHYYNSGKPISVMMPYSYSLKDMADWYRQLWAESLGKATDLEGNEVFVGPTPVKALGATDQHSQVQLYREGPNDKLFTILGVKDFDSDVKIGNQPDCAPELSYLAGASMNKLINSERMGTEYALLHSKRPVLTVIFDKITPFTVGQFIYLFEATTSIAGELLGINTYDQPAVELGKEATFALMGHTDYAELAEKIKPVTEIDEEYLV